MGTATSICPAASPPQSAVDAVPLSFEVLADDAVAEVIPEWDACTAGGANTFALSPWFSTMVWNFDVSKRGELCLVAGRDAERHVRALLPLWLSRSRVPLLGLRTLQPVCLPGQEISSILVGDIDRAAATASMVDYLLGPASQSFDVLHFETIDPGGVLFGVLVETAQRLALPVWTSRPEPVAEVRASAGLARSARRSLRRALRRARQAGCEIVCRDISWEWDAHVESIVRMHQAPGADPVPNSGLALHDENVRTLLGAMLRRLDRYFRAHAFAAFVDGELAACAIAFRGNREVTLWNAAVDPRFQRFDVGSLLRDHCLRDFAHWPGVATITVPKASDRDEHQGQRCVCELAIVCATGLRRRRALWRWAARATDRPLTVHPARVASS